MHPRQVAQRLPRAPGVYRFRDGRDRVLYTGRAGDLRRRAASYWTDLGDRRHLAPKVAQIRRVEAVVCDSAHEAAWLERNLLERHLPRWNRTPGGQEVPAYLWLHRPTDRRGPRLTTAHRPPDSAGVRCFGPYLGGARVRLAAAALHRVFALDPALGAARGVAVPDPAEVVARITAALGRDPHAVGAVDEALRLRRDRASSRLAFEVAARVQAESDALAWILAEQKVTTREPLDLDVHGWSDGVLVGYEIRGGRLSRWTQRSGTRDDAGPHLAATPPAWRPFAHRNATLAAALDRP